MIKILQTYPKTFLFCMGCISALATAPVYAWPLMMVGYSSLLYFLVHAKNWAHTGAYAFIFFLGFFVTGLYWISSSLFVDFNRWWWALPFSFIGLPVLLSLFTFVIISFMHCLSGQISKMDDSKSKYATAISGFQKPVLMIIGLILIDLARGHLFTGFPWNMPAHTWTHTPVMMATLPYIGYYGLNALTIVLFTLPAWIILKSNLLCGVFITLFALITLITPPYSKAEMTLPDTIIMVQANILQDEKWNPNYIKRNINRYIEMSLDHIDQLDVRSPITLIWPETAISDSIYNYPYFNKRIDTLLNTMPSGSHIITGYLHQAHDGFFNSLATIDAQKGLEVLYSKHHLVPFGEYMPFGLDTLTGFTGLGHGDTPKPISVGGYRFLPLICYEIIFPHYAALTDKSDFIINLTNDAWFGDTAGPYQHFDHAIFRALENKTPVIRLSGNGISAVITNQGRILSASGLNETNTMVIKRH